MKWRLIFSVLCDKNIPPRLKDKFYRTVVKTTMLYKVECEPIENSHVHEKKLAKMRLLR